MATFEVTNTDDSGAGSLRQAIVDANAAAGADTIDFLIPSGATIVLTSGYLQIGTSSTSGDLTIDGDLNADGQPDITIQRSSTAADFGVIRIDDGHAGKEQITLAGLTITGGSDSAIKAINADLTIDSSAITGNSTPAAGGGLWAFVSDVEIVDSVISNNVAVQGGGVFVDAGTTADISRTTIADNVAISRGGGLSVAFGNNSVTIDSSTVSGNGAASGGGISGENSAMAVTNSTIVNNSATTASGLVLTNDGTLAISNTTITDNTGDGVLLVQSSSLDLANSLVLGNSSDDIPNLGGTFTQSGVNLIGGDASTVFDPAGLADNGGPTRTVALLDSVDNPALAAATTDSGAVIPATDQRGETRPAPAGTAADLGAFELEQNLQPSAGDDSDNTAFATPVTITVLTNDSDPDGTLVPTSVMVASQGGKGTAVANRDGTITYTPDAGESGQDSFIYTVDDNDGATSNAATVTVTIAAANEPPVAVDDTASTTFLTAAIIPVLANDSDPDGTLDPTSVAVTDNPANGVATANADGTVTYTPNFLSIGDDSFAYTVADDRAGTSNEATVSVAVGDDLNVMDGTDRADTRLGTNGPDLIQTLGRGDTVFARGGDDLVLGGAGRDSLFGQNGDDTLFGGAGKDALSGGNGLDILVGGPGNDSLFGGSGLDTAIFAGDFADHRLSGFGTFRTVQDRAGDGGRDGLTSVELLQFDDGVFDARNGQFTEGGHATPEVQALVTSPGFSTDPEPLLAPVV